MARSGLDALPGELLNEICGYLCWHCRGGHATSIRPFELESNNGELEPPMWKRDEQTGLASLSRTCRVLHMAAEPFLYHYFYTFQNHDLYFFFRTVSERPDLAAIVSEVEVGHAGGVPTTVRRPDVIEGGVRRAGLKPEDPAEAREGVEHDVLFSQLLQLMPNLERFHFRQFGGPFPTRPDPSLSSLVSLKNVALSGFKKGGYVLDRAISTLRLAPNLEILHCYGCLWVSQYFVGDLGRKTREERLPSSSAALTQPPPLQNLVELRLTDTLLTVHSLIHLLGAVGPGLSKVSIRRSGLPPPSGWGSRHNLEFGEAVYALRPWSQTLREFTFSIDGIVEPRQDPPHGLHLAGRLRDFRVLQILQVQECSFDFPGYFRRQEDALTSTLPVFLRELRVMRSIYCNIVPALQALLGAVTNGQFADLKRIEIDNHHWGVAGELTELTELTELRELGVMFQSAGVDFVTRPEAATTEIRVISDEENDSPFQSPQN
ncbi:hypothetical protein MFIFM68171_10709 [Madurella fahalii]|uniref:F-box domain-containing protein n=1 Tax=Madurella fahalii TaxID=1157608 RepID=A0ABQ0GS20_9PEZI